MIGLSEWIAKLELLHSRIIAEKTMVERSWRTRVTWSRVVGMSAVSWCPWYMMMMMVCTAVAMWHAQLYIHYIQNEYGWTHHTKTGKQNSMCLPSWWNILLSSFTLAYTSSHSTLWYEENFILPGVWKWHSDIYETRLIIAGRLANQLIHRSLSGRP